METFLYCILIAALIYNFYQRHEVQMLKADLEKERERNQRLKQLTPLHFNCKCVVEGERLSRNSIIRVVQKEKR